MLKILAVAAATSVCALSVQAAAISVTTFDAASYNGSYGVGAIATEDFEGLGATLGEGEVGAPFSTAVGDFETLGGVGTGGTVTQSAPNSGEFLALRDGDVFGRTNTTPTDGDWYLDSNDTFGMSWEAAVAGGASFNRLVFTLLDGGDTGAFLRISAGGEEVELRTGGRLANGNAQIVEITFASMVDVANVVLGNYTMSGGDTLRINDGFSVDGFQVAAVPLPASVLLLGGALAGVGAMRRRKS